MVLMVSVTDLALGMNCLLLFITLCLIRILRLDCLEPPTPRGHARLLILQAHDQGIHDM